MRSDSELILAFLEYQEHSRGSSRRTVDKYHGYLVRLVEFLREERKRHLLDAQLEDLEAFTGMHSHKRGVTPRSRRPIVAAVRGFYRWCVRVGELQRSPAESISYPRFGRPLPTALSLENAQKLIMAPGVTTFVGVRDTAILAVLIGAGVRVSGLISLNESDLRFHQDGGREELVLLIREKGKAERLVPVDDYVRLMLRAYLGHPELDGIDRLLEDGDRVLFVSVANSTVPAHEFRGEARRLNARSINRMMEKYGRSCGVPPSQLHPHAARHLYGVSMAEDQQDLLRIQALMGHQDPKTTAEYVRLAVRLLGQTVRKSAPTSKIETPVTPLVRELSKR